MTTRPFALVLLLAASLGLSGCAAGLIGAGAAIGADQIAEDEGGNLF